MMQPAMVDASPTKTAILKSPLYHQSGEVFFDCFSDEDDMYYEPNFSSSADASDSGSVQSVGSYSMTSPRNLAARLQGVATPDNRQQKSQDTKQDGIFNDSIEPSPVTTTPEEKGTGANSQMEVFETPALESAISYLKNFGGDAIAAGPSPDDISNEGWLRDFKKLESQLDYILDTSTVRQSDDKGVSDSKEGGDPLIVGSVRDASIENSLSIEQDSADYDLSLETSEHMLHEELSVIQTSYLAARLNRTPSPVFPSNPTPGDDTMEAIRSDFRNIGEVFPLEDNSRGRSLTLPPRGHLSPTTKSQSIEMADAETFPNTHPQGPTNAVTTTEFTTISSPEQPIVSSNTLPDQSMDRQTRVLGRSQLPTSYTDLSSPEDSLPASDTHDETNNTYAEERALDENDNQNHHRVSVFDATIENSMGNIGLSGGNNGICQPTTANEEGERIFGTETSKTDVPLDMHQLESGLDNATKRPLAPESTSTIATTILAEERIDDDDEFVYKAIQHGSPESSKKAFKPEFELVEEHRNTESGGEDPQYEGKKPGEIRDTPLEGGRDQVQPYTPTHDVLGRANVPESSVGEKLSDMAVKNEVPEAHETFEGDVMSTGSKVGTIDMKPLSVGVWDKEPLFGRENRDEVGDTKISLSQGTMESSEVEVGNKEVDVSNENELDGSCTPILPEPPSQGGQNGSVDTVLNEGTTTDGLENSMENTSGNTKLDGIGSSTLIVEDKGPEGDIAVASPERVDGNFVQTPAIEAITEVERTELAGNSEQEGQPGRAGGIASDEATMDQHRVQTTDGQPEVEKEKKTVTTSFDEKGHARSSGETTRPLDTDWARRDVATLPAIFEAKSPKSGLQLENKREQSPPKSTLSVAQEKAAGSSTSLKSTINASEEAPLSPPRPKREVNSNLLSRFDYSFNLAGKTGTQESELVRGSGVGRDGQSTPTRVGDIREKKYPRAQQRVAGVTFPPAAPNSKTKTKSSPKERLRIVPPRVHPDSRSPHLIRSPNARPTSRRPSYNAPTLRTSHRAEVRRQSVEPATPHRVRSRSPYKPNSPATTRVPTSPLLSPPRSGSIRNRSPNHSLRGGEGRPGQTRLRGPQNSPITPERRLDVRKPMYICKNKFAYDLHQDMGPCDRCWSIASSRDRQRFIETGSSLSIVRTRGGCGEECLAFPLDDGPLVRLCRQCFHATHSRATDRLKVYKGKTRA